MPIDSRPVIMDAMKNLVLKKNLNKITVHDITKYCNLTRGTFYYYFDNKFDLIEKIFIYDIGYIDVSSSSSILISTKNILDSIYNNKNYYYRIFKSLEFRTFLYNYFEILIYEWMCFNYDQNEFDPSKLKFSVRMINYSIVGMLIKWSYTSFEDSPDLLLENFIFFTSLTSNIKKE